MPVYERRGPGGRPRRGSVGPPAGSVRSPPAGKRKGWGKAQRGQARKGPAGKRKRVSVGPPADVSKRRPAGAPLIDLFRLRKTVFGKNIFTNPSGIRFRVRNWPGGVF